MKHALFKTRFIISVIATIPILLLSPTIQGIFAFTLVFPASTLILFLLATFVYGYGGWPFLQGCVHELRHKRIGMMTLIAMAITTAEVYSSLVFFKLVPGKTFFWEVATLIDIMLLGHWIEMKSIAKAKGSLKKLATLLPSHVSLVMPNGSTKEIRHKDLAPNDKVLIKPGETIPSDGIVTEGNSAVDQSLLTGESKPVFKAKGDTVIGGSINQTGSLVVQINKTGEETYLSKIMTLITQAMASKSKAQTIADQAAFILTIIALLAGIGTLMVWLSLQGSMHFALERMVTVMVITCPHALGLAIPLVISSVTAIAAQNGLLIRNRKGFEQLRKSTIVIFDKTGTLTTGKFGVTKIVSLSTWNETQILEKAAAVERKSEHFVAKSIVRAAQESSLRITPVANFKSMTGLGATAVVGVDKLFVGSPDIIRGNATFKANFSIEQVKKAQQLIKHLTSHGKTVIIVATETQIKGIIALSDMVRKESITTCNTLKKLRIKMAMITGDNADVAHDIADQLGIKHVFAGVLPHEKAAKVKELQGYDQHVTMVGDGINDAPALAQADVGIAIGAGTSIAADTSDIILVNSNPADVVKAIKLSRVHYKKVIQNILWATGYNLVALPIAAGILYPYGILLPPAIGALIMSASTIIVAINSRLIKDST